MIEVEDGITVASDPIYWRGLAMDRPSLFIRAHYQQFVSQVSANVLLDPTGPPPTKVRQRKQPWPVPLFDKLEKQFDMFPQFEDVSAAVLGAETARDARLDKEAKIAQ